MVGEVGDCKSGLELYRESQTLLEKILEPKNHQTIKTTQDMVRWLCTLGKYNEAYKLCEQEPKCMKEILRDCHYFTLYAVRPKAKILDVQGKYKDSAKLYKWRLKGLGKIFVEDLENNLMIECNANFANAYRHLSKLSWSRLDSFWQLFSIQKRTLHLLKIPGDDFPPFWSIPIPVE